MMIKANSISAIFIGLSLVMLTAAPLHVAHADVEPNPPTLTSINGQPIDSAELSWERPHELTGLPMTLDGWTDFRAMYQHPDYYNDSRIVYVSSSNGDDNSGVVYSAGDAELNDSPFDVDASAIRPFATIDAARRHLRGGYPDILLLMRGDSWNESLNSAMGSGRSSTERRIIASYGASRNRPQLTPQDSLFNSSASNLALADFEYVPAHKDPSSPSFQSSDQDRNRLLFRTSGTIQNILVENTKSRYGHWIIQGFNGGQVRNVAFRRNIVVDSYQLSGGGHAQGLYMVETHNTLIEDNLFDHNGWSQEISGANPTIFNHNMYMATRNTSMVVRGNISARASSHGIQQRPGGTLEGNLFLANPVNALMGGGHDSDEAQPNGVTGSVRNNIILGSRDIGSNPRGFGIHVTNIRDIEVVDNVIAHLTDDSSGNRIPLDITLSSVTRSVKASRNRIWQWQGNIRIEGQAPSQASVGLERNRIHDSDADLVQIDSLTLARYTSVENRFSTGNSTPFRIHGTRISLSDYLSLTGDSTSLAWTPDNGDAVPTIADYATSIGLSPSKESFLAAARSQSRWNWNTQLTAKAAVAYFSHTN